jgi:glycosyltransferase involved in cell wall biosynthesis
MGQPLKIAVFNTYDQTGGAAIACWRLCKAFSRHGYDVHLLVLEQHSDTPFVYEVTETGKTLKKYLRKVQYAWEKRRVFRPGYVFSHQPWILHHAERHPLVQEADILHLHWINQGLMGPKGLLDLFSLGKPIIWHMHDYWAFTGGCHYPGKCRNFEHSCGQCPALRHPGPEDISHWGWLYKQRAFQLNPPTLVAPSAWLAREAQASALGSMAEVLHIPNPIDTDIFKEGDPLEAKKLLNLPFEKKILFFAAMNTHDTRKGFSELKQALHILAREGESMELLIAGRASAEMLANFPFKTHHLGPLKEVNMRVAYLAADLFVIPSLEENLPNTVLESLACGTPVAGFRTGGIPEMVEEGFNGFLSETGDIQGLANAIRKGLRYPDPAQFRRQALEKIKNGYLPEQVCGKYQQLFEKRMAERNQT